MKLLQLKHWQLFIITFVIPFVSYLVGLIVFIIGMINLGLDNKYGSGREITPNFSNFIPLIISGVFALAGAVILYIWLYECATKLQAYMHPEMRKLKVKRFKAFFFFPFVYMALIFGMFPLLFHSVKDGEPTPGPFILFSIVMFLGNLFAGFCSIYVLYFVAKTIKSAEIQREAHFGDYIGEFFLTWFYPVGVWFLQPKINKIISEEYLEPSVPTKNEQLDF